MTAMSPPWSVCLVGWLAGFVSGEWGGRGALVCGGVAQPGKRARHADGRADAGTYQPDEEVDAEDARKGTADDDGLARPQVHGAAEQLPGGNGVLVGEGAADEGHAPRPDKDEDAQGVELRDAEVLGEGNAVKEPHPGAHGHAHADPELGAEGVDERDLAAREHSQASADEDGEARTKEGEVGHGILARCVCMHGMSDAVNGQPPRCSTVPARPGTHTPTTTMTYQ